MRRLCFSGSLILLVAVATAQTPARRPTTVAALRQFPSYFHLQNVLVQGEFVENGYLVRRINQAYFAFNGFYAFSAGSIDPIGPKLQELFEREGSPGAFLRVVRGITSRTELDQAVASASG